MQAPSLLVNRLCGTAALLAGAAVVQAMPMTLVDQNSAAFVDPYSQMGQGSWIVEDYNHVNKQWFWYRAGDMSAESSIDTLQLMSFDLSDTNPLVDTSMDTLAAVFQDAGQQYQIQLGMHLTGAAWGSGRSDLTEQITIRNLTTAPLTFHFYQYVDMDMDNEPLGDVLNFVSDSTVVQHKPGGSWAIETVLTPTPNHHEAHLVPATLDKLNDALLTTLDDLADAGPDNLAWAFEWDTVIAPGGEFQIMKDKQIVPDVSTLAMLALSVFPLIRKRRRA